MIKTLFILTILHLLGVDEKKHQCVSYEILLKNARFPVPRQDIFHSPPNLGEDYALRFGNETAITIQ
jgi:hypothetical protein